jgi:hypothetical protein
MNKIRDYGLKAVTLTGICHAVLISECERFAG